MTVTLRCRDFEVLYLIINLHNSTISGVSKRTDTKEGIKFRVIMEHEDFFLLVNAQELLLVTTKLSVKQNNPIFDVETSLYRVILNDCSRSRREN
jgi:hypothetical protein